KFGLGYSLLDPLDLIRAFRAAGINDSEAELAGLVFPGNGKDRLCGRLIFPIRGLSGKVVAFGGRLLQTDKDKAKYINSAESEFYRKRSELYGLYEAKKAIVKTENCFLVEGYTDVLRLHETGTEEVVAPLGTAFTAEQAAKLRRFTERVTILTDGDRAGLNAAYKQLEILLTAGLQVCFIPLPDATDPDDFFRDKAGEEVVRYLKEESRDALLYFAGLIWQKAGADPHKKAKGISEMVRLLRLIPDRVKRLFYMKELRNITGLPDIRMLDPDSYQKEKPVVNKFSELYETMDEQIERRLISWVIYAANQPLLVRSGCDGVVWQTTVYAFVETIMQDEELQFSNPQYQR
ncbi:MAG: toprim domain-containing protein, partial [Morganella morganii]